MNSIPVRPFSEYVLRTPLFSLDSYIDLLNGYTLEKALAYLENPFFKEAIYLASPELLILFNRLKEHPETLSQEKRVGLEFTLLKYISRISSRCTPFGLFAGCTVGGFSSETNIELKSYHQFERFTQFDTHFWIGFLQKIEKQKEYIHSLTYYPNNSIYSFGDFYRYIEYKYQDNKREHSISAILKSPVLEQVLQQVQKGSSVNEIVSHIADESERKEALLFIYQLIDFQFLVSELEAGVTGNDEMERVLNIIKKIPSSENIQKLLQNFKDHLNTIDTLLVNTENIYTNIKQRIEIAEFDYEPKYLFQTDLNTTTSVNTLNNQISKKIIEALTFLNGIQKHQQPRNLAEFINAFSKRYETREIALATVLDTEIGIGYLQSYKNNDSHSILDKFSFQSISKKNETETWTEIDFILERKLQNAIQNNQTEIILSEKDFPNFDSNFNNLPPTFSVITEIFKNEGDKEIISIDFSGNTTASKLFGRFCNGNDGIHHLTKAIIDKEKEHYKDKIVAEIAHIPESRTGNISRRPVLRDYEIPYLAKSGVTSEFQIEVSDLTVSVYKNRIILKSRKHNKEVVPFLSNSHNYSSNSLPIYHFLCDLQYQNKKPIYGFKWGVLEKHHSFFSRVKYKEIVLC
ncbi:MAG: lantibiotic dehydratase family protein, partial [Flavobacterium sp.]